MSWDQLSKYADNQYSQAGEDGVLNRIFELIGTTDRRSLEFGGSDGATYSNTRRLIDQGWDGIMWDGHYESSLVRREFITADNINQLLDQYQFPQQFDLLSIDIDGNDYWVWQAITRRPRVVVIEFNAAVPPGESRTVPYDPQFRHDLTDYYGASFEALRRLGESKGYTLVANTGNLNLIFVLRELVDQPPRVGYQRVQGHRADPLGRPWVQV